MLDCPNSEPATEFLQRRWFATRHAVKSLEAECDLLLEVLKMSESSWRRAHTQLAELRVIRDGLEQELDALEFESAEHGPMAADGDGSCAGTGQLYATQPRVSQPTGHGDISRGEVLLFAPPLSGRRA